MFKINDIVTIYNTASNLDGKLAKIIGKYGKNADITFWILRFDSPIDEEGTTGLIMISSCLKKYL